MTTSMTGYGQGQAQSGSLKLTVEMNSVNRKQLEFAISLPRELESLEGLVRSKLNQRLSRGRIQCRVRMSDLEGHDKIRPRINQSLANACIQALSTLANENQLASQPSLELLVRLPGVVSMEADLPDPGAVESLLNHALDTALDGLLKMRQTEGELLLIDLRQRIKHIGELVDKIRPLTSDLTQRHREILLKRLEEAGLEQIDPHDERLLKEIVLHADRCDISEEITRLESHLVHFEKLIANHQAVGRSLDFLSQEIFREINTIGSKASNHVIAHLVVEMKTTLEKFREQVQNLE